MNLTFGTGKTGFVDNSETAEHPTEPTGPNQYRCASCNGIFEKGWSDEEAMEEKNRDFGNAPMEDCVVVCDDCYQKFRPDTHPKEYEAYKSAQN